MSFEQIGQLPDQLATVLRRGFRPRPGFKGAARGLHRRVDIGGIGLGHRGDRLTGCRVVDVEPLAGFCIDPFAIDQQLMLGG